jgi:hypothetical protein
VRLAARRAGVEGIKMESTDGWKWQERCRCLHGLGRQGMDGTGHGTKADKSQRATRTTPGCPAPPSLQLTNVDCSPLLQGAQAWARHTVSTAPANSRALLPYAALLPALARHSACVRAEKTGLSGRRNGECMQRT